MADADRPEHKQRAWLPLSLPRIEPRCKNIVVADDFSVHVDLTDRQTSDFIAIKNLIRTGGDLAPYYRKSATADRLLATRQVLHLHLGGPGSNAILYAVQYPGHVLLVRIDTHIHLDDIPPGKALPLRGMRGFQDRLKAAQHDTAQNLAAAKVRLLKPKR